MVTDRKIILVTFHGTGEAYAFGSIAAIFDKFTQVQIGADARRIYASDITGRGLNTPACNVKRLSLYCKPQNK